MSVIDSPNVVTTGSMKNNTMRMVAGSRKTTGAAYRSEGEGESLPLPKPPPPPMLPLPISDDARIRRSRSCASNVQRLLHADLIANRSLNLASHETDALLR